MPLWPVRLLIGKGHLTHFHTSCPAAVEEGPLALWCPSLIYSSFCLGPFLYLLDFDPLGLELLSACASTVIVFSFACTAVSEVTCNSVFLWLLPFATDFGSCALTCSSAFSALVCKATAAWPQAACVPWHFPFLHSAQLIFFLSGL